MMSYWIIDEIGTKICIASIRTKKEYDRLYHMCKDMLVPVGD